jgi:hypothetical protein
MGSIEDVEDYIHSLSVAELKEMTRKAKPIQLNWTAEELAQMQAYNAQQEATDLSYDALERIDKQPFRATLGEIQQYCQGLNLDMLGFLKNIVEKK